MPELSAPLPLVLVVEGDSSSADVVRNRVGLEGEAEVVVTDGRDALSVFDRRRPDLVVLDIHTPGADGHALLEVLRSRVDADEFLPVLVVTGDRVSDSKQRALAAGAADVMVEPFDPIELSLRVRNLLQTRALHLRLQEHGRSLAERLELQEEIERRLADVRRERRSRIEGVLAGLGLTMLFQPIVHLDAATVLGVEALARFTTGPSQVPDAWFAEAADVGLGPDLEVAAIALAVSQFHHVPAEAYLSVNVSPATVLSGMLKDVLAPLPTTRVVLELTEHDKVEDYDVLNAALDEVRATGIRLAVDDAGAGFSSLRHILSLRPDIIKLDLALTRGIATDPVRRALAASLVSFAGEIGAVITAEGVETLEELEVLQHLGVGAAQGFFLCRPGPLPLPAQLTYGLDEA